ncbi:MAG: sensor histidine kinase [Methylococcaceae bacterium]|jgi:signal transduction histidine kinase
MLTITPSSLILPDAYEDNDTHNSTVNHPKEMLLRNSFELLNKLDAKLPTHLSVDLMVVSPANTQPKLEGNFALLIDDLANIEAEDTTLSSKALNKRYSAILPGRSYGINEIIFEQTDLNHYLSTLTAEFENFEGGKITLDVDKNVSFCCIDQAIVKIILNNILSNAVKYSDGQMNIRLSVALFNFKNEKWLNFSVTDTGIGMSSDQIENIFEPFYRANPFSYVPGNGLGMTVVKELIGDLNGSVDIKSTLNEGTTINVKLKFFPTPSSILA